MRKQPLEVAIFSQDNAARFVAYTWDKYYSQKQEWIKEQRELRNYLFATDTSTTSNSSLPWKNSTTIPKLTQIRDNLHSNYLSALFPNDNWMRWEGYSPSDDTKRKKRAISAYMSNKCRESHFRQTMSKLLYDYIDYGNAFATATFESSYKDMEDGSRIPAYTGPVAVRISPLDIVFNPLSDTLQNSFKIIRSIRTIGELKKMSKEEPDNAMLAEAIAERESISKRLAGYSKEDTDKAEGYSIDGFGNLYEYYQSQYVEILEFYGDYYSSETGELTENQIITVVDRARVIRQQTIPSWLGHAPIYHVGWRLRTDNLYAMGPLHNLVGMQYTIDKLENAKMDAMDLAIHPPLVVSGEVEEFSWGPGVEITMDEGGNIQELGKNLGPMIQADNMIAMYEQRMEQYAGAPREAAGMRTPGEKTAFEVQSLQNAAGRIFQEKITTFETELLEPLLNCMLEVSRRNMDYVDVIRVMNDDLHVESFMEVTKEDITASGNLRPIGARHFAAQAQLLQNMNGIFNSQIGQLLSPHTSAKALASLVEDIIGVERYGLFTPNVALGEQMETQMIASQLQEEMALQQSTPAPN